MAKLQTQKQVKDWLIAHKIKNYTIHKDLSVSVDGNVDLIGCEIVELTVSFAKVSGDFICDSNELTTLNGCPQMVGGNFSCAYNKLTSLKGCPQIVHNFDCTKNNLTSLEFAPKSVGESFYCGYNALKSLDFAPKTVPGDFYCHHNFLSSLKGAPSQVRSLKCSNNDLHSFEGISSYISGDFTSMHNSIKTFKYFPESISGQFIFSQEKSLVIFKDLYHHTALVSVSGSMVKTLLAQVDTSKPLETYEGVIEPEKLSAKSLRIN